MLTRSFCIDTNKYKTSYTKLSAEILNRGLVLIPNNIKHAGTCSQSYGTLISGGDIEESIKHTDEKATFPFFDFHLHWLCY